MILDIAAFWSSIARFDDEHGHYEIRGVMGPDEFHDSDPDSPEPGLTNNAYTNVMAVWVLCRALEVLELLSEMRRAELTTRLGLSAGLFSVPNSIRAITPLVGKILVEHKTHHGRDEVSELHLFYNRPTAGAGYESVTQRLLPLDETWRRKLVEIPWSAQNLPDVIGDGTATLRALIREYLFVSIFRACAESLASENASRWPRCNAPTKTSTNFSLSCTAPSINCAKAASTKNSST